MKKVALIVAVVIIIVCSGGIFAFSKYKQAMAAKTSDPGRNEATVERGSIQIQVVETGTVDAVKAVEVKSRVAGRLKQLLVDEGDVVQAGQLIGIIDPQETELRVKQDQAQLRGARSAVERASVEISQRRITAREALDRAKKRVEQLELELKVQPTLTKAAIDTAQTAYESALQARDQLVKATQPNERTAAESALREAESTVRNAEREAQRREDLLAKGYVSLREAEDARLQLDLARTRLKAAQDRYARIDAQQKLELQQAEQRVLQTAAELSRAKANQVQDKLKAKEYETALSALRDAEAGLRDVEALALARAQSQATVDQIDSSVRESLRQLGETEIRAPLSGVVAKRMIQEGELVSSLSSFSSGTPIVRIEDRRAMLVKLSINEIDVAKLKLGMPAKVNVDAIPNHEFEGTVTKIAPTSVQGTAQSSGDPVVRYQVEIQIADRDERLKSGMSAKCTVVALKLDNVLKLPIEFVAKDAKGRYAMLPADKKDPKSKPKRVDLKTGEETPTAIQILEGLKEGQKVVKPEYKGPKRKGAQFGPPEEDD